MPSNPFLYYIFLCVRYSKKGFSNQRGQTELTRRGNYGKFHQSLDFLIKGERYMARLEKKDVLRIAKQKKVKFIRQTLGDHVFYQYVENKKIEWERYRAQVTDYKLEQYLAIL